MQRCQIDTRQLRAKFIGKALKEGRNKFVLPDTVLKLQHPFDEAKKVYVLEADQAVCMQHSCFG